MTCLCNARILSFKESAYCWLLTAFWGLFPDHCHLPHNHCTNTLTMSCQCFIDIFTFWTNLASPTSSSSASVRPKTRKDLRSWSPLRHFRSCCVAVTQKCDANFVSASPGLPRPRRRRHIRQRHRHRSRNNRLPKSEWADIGSTTVTSRFARTTKTSSSSSSSVSASFLFPIQRRRQNFGLILFLGIRNRSFGTRTKPEMKLD